MAQMTRNRFHTLAGAAALFTAFTVCGESIAQDSSWFAQETSLTRAHAQFLEGNLSSMALELKKALMENPNDPSVLQNVSSLLAKAYGSSGEVAIPADWKLPAGIEEMRVAVRRRNDKAGAKIRYRMTVSGETVERGLIEQLQVIRYPNEVIADKVGHVGEWDDADGVFPQPQYWLASTASKTPPAEGLYLLNIKVKGQPLVQGWFINSGLATNESPVVLEPSVDGEYATPNPTFKWNDLITPLYQKGEHRSMYVTVRDESFMKELWMFYTGNPRDTQQVTLGKQPHEQGAKSLSPANYNLSVSFAESRNFGPIQLRRQCLTVLPFRITH